MDANEIRAFVRDRYVEPARRRGESRVRVTAGDVHRDLRLSNRVPAVCSALKSNKFLKENRLEIEAVEGPPSGQGTTVAMTYRLTGSDNRTSEAMARFLKLRGIAKASFGALGGGE